VTPVHNITDDLSWIHGRHTFQFGGNVRLISNARVSFSNAFDDAVTNPSFYLGAGDHVSNSFQAYLDANGLPGDENAGQSLNSIAEVQNAATAIIGRFSEYTADFTFAKDGSLESAGTPTKRNFATQSYDEYVQDVWKVRPQLTLTLGLRYSLERPVYEKQGFEVQPTVPLGTYFQDRLAAASQGNNFVDPIIVNRSGPVNGGKPMYNWDKNNFQPRIAVAWSPNYSTGLLHALFGDAGKSVIRGGFAITNDYYGEYLRYGAGQPGAAVHGLQPGRAVAAQRSGPRAITIPAIPTVRQWGAHRNERGFESACSNGVRVEFNVRTRNAGGDNAVRVVYWPKGTKPLGTARRGGV
jgi:hypothetical protein